MREPLDCIHERVQATRDVVDEHEVLRIRDTFVAVVDTLLAATDAPSTTAAAS
jgi:hypothetical protein